MFSTLPAKIWSVVILVLALIVAGLFVLIPDTLYAWHWEHAQFHSTIETLGGVTAFLISLFLFRESQAMFDYRQVMVATGFAVMGVLDTSHAMSRPGDAFIFLHSVASLCGGFFFASVWLVHGRRLQGRFEHYFIYFGSIILSVSVGLRALVYPGDVPKIMPLFDGEFTMAAVLINTAASLLFLTSAPKFLQMYRQERHARNLLFMSLASLFGVAEMIFQFSRPWNGMWWIWHLIRLAAFIATLVFVVRGYRMPLKSRKV